LEIQRLLLNVILVVIAAVFLFVVASLLMIGKKTKDKKKTTLGVLAIIPLGLVVTVLIGLNVLCEKYASYEFGAYPDEEHYYLGLSIDEDGNMQYIVPPDFSIGETVVDVKHPIIAGRMDTVGFNNHYKKYLGLGNVEIWWDTYEDMFIMSKYTAIQFGLLEPTGAEDEKEFKIATSEDELQDLQESLDGSVAEESESTAE
jgi:hypothetical protein